MGWSFRRSLNLGGGVRLNFSKSGVGVSGGIRGFRFGMSPNGRHYVSCGAAGVRYQQSYGTATQNQPKSAAHSFVGSSIPASSEGFLLNVNISVA